MDGVVRFASQELIPIASEDPPGAAATPPIGMLDLSASFVEKR